MIIERSESPQWTSNAYLVADREGGRGILIDGNGVVEPLIARAQELGVDVCPLLALLSFQRACRLQVIRSGMGIAAR